MYFVWVVIVKSLAQDQVSKNQLKRRKSLESGFTLIESWLIQDASLELAKDNNGGSYDRKDEERRKTERDFYWTMKSDLYKLK